MTEMFVERSCNWYAMVQWWEFTVTSQITTASTSLASGNSMFLRDMPFQASARSQTRRPCGTLADDLAFFGEHANVTRRSGEWCWIGRGWISSKYLGSPFTLAETLNLGKWWIGSQTIAAGANWWMYVDWCQAHASYATYDMNRESDKVEHCAKVAMDQQKRAWDVLHDCVPSEPQSIIFLCIAFPKTFSFW
jgi:hypothetical protein